MGQDVRKKVAKDLQVYVPDLCARWSRWLCCFLQRGHLGKAGFGSGTNQEFSFNRIRLIMM